MGVTSLMSETVWGSSQIPGIAGALLLRVGQICEEYRDEEFLRDVQLLQEIVRVDLT